jgi:ABC-2 type transport system ATP-binding protein
MTADSGYPPLRADGLGKQYRRGWALRDCSFDIPANRVVALVGPNGAGKSTLMNLVTGITKPTTGTVEVFGERPSGRGLHPRLAFLGQQKALYSSLTVAETLRFGARMNPTWDQAYAEGMVTSAGVPLSAKIGTLSGGQRTRVAVAVAWGKRPGVVLLDEPLADLDPLAREETLRLLMNEARQHGITVVLSSHVLAELESICDYLLMIVGGHVRLAGDVRQVISRHRLLTGPSRTKVPGAAVDVVDDGTRTTSLVRDLPGAVLPPWRVGPARLEDIVLGYMRALATEPVTREGRVA